MKKRKKIEEIIENNSISNNLNEIFIYKRKFNLIYPIPYKFKLDLKKIKEFKV